MFQTSILKDEHIEPLAEAVCRVLAEVGVLCQNHELLAALRDWVQRDEAPPPSGTLATDPRNDVLSGQGLRLLPR